MSTKVQDPKSYFAEVTPSDDPIKNVDGISVDTAGTIFLTDQAGNNHTITLAGGVMHPIRPLKIRAGGSASGITKYWNE